MNNTPLFYKDEPIFGLDIGFSSIKVMQISHSNKKIRTVAGYGTADFDSKAIKDGVIVNPEVLAKTIHDLFSNGLTGNITTKRVAISIPASRTFNRVVRLPNMSKKDLAEAVRLEAEQYIPVPIEDLYIDFSITEKGKEETELFVVAAPCKLVDSYMVLADMLGLEVAAIETSISALSRLFTLTDQSDVPTILVDLGSVSSDLTVFDKTILVTSTIAGGGDKFTNMIAESLKVTKQEAQIIKIKYGLSLSKKQKEITTGVKPFLDELIKEFRRMIRYYEERTATKSKITQIVTTGGGANMPGLAEFMTNSMRLPVRMCNPWQYLKFHKSQTPSNYERSIYLTVAGLALMDGTEIFSND